MASPTIPSLKLPFTSFPGLDMESSRRIWRDFEAVAAAITPGAASMFDAVIDPSLTASNPATHRYVNLTELVANETWTTVLNVGVFQRRTVVGAAGSQITEPGPISLAGKGDLSLFGIKPSGTNLGVTMGWNWRSLTSVANGQSINYTGLTFEPSIATAMQSGGEAIFRDCSFGPNVTSFNGLGISGGAYATQVWNCDFLGNTMTFGNGSGDAIVVTMMDCRFNSTNFTVTTNGELSIYAGAFYQNAGTINITAAGKFIMSATGSMALNASGNSPGYCFAQLSGNGNSSATVSATTAQVGLWGQWRTVTFTGTPTVERIFNGRCESISFAGPGTCIAVVIAQAGLGGFPAATLSGSGVMARLTLAGVFLQCNSLTNSHVLCEFQNLTGSYYTIDNASHNNTFILNGTRSASFVPGSVSLGTGLANRIITEDSDTLLTGTGGAMGNNMLNAEIAAVNSGVTVYGGNTAVNDLYGPAFLLGGM